MDKGNKEFMKKAIRLAINGMAEGKGGPFGAVIVKEGEIISTGYNQVTSINDPTAHAEVMAIREACRKLNTFQLTGCELYTSCEPCPMCLGAIYWARPDKVYYAATKFDAAAAGFDDQFIYDEIGLPTHKRKIPMISIMREEALLAFEAWKNKENREDY